MINLLYTNNNNASSTIAAPKVVKAFEEETLSQAWLHTLKSKHLGDEEDQEELRSNLGYLRDLRPAWTMWDQKELWEILLQPSVLLESHLYSKGRVGMLLQQSQCLSTVWNSYQTWRNILHLFSWQRQSPSLCLSSVLVARNLQRPHYFQKRKPEGKWSLLGRVVLHGQLV